MPNQALYLKIAVKRPLRQHFDYLPPIDYPGEQIHPGMRVILPFGNKKQTVGVILATSDSTQIAQKHIKRVEKILGPGPLISAKMLALLQWASRYYHHPIGEVIFQALPKKLHQPSDIPERDDMAWWHIRQTEDATALPQDGQQQQLYAFLQQQTSPLETRQITKQFPQAKELLDSLWAKRLLTKTNSPPYDGPDIPPNPCPIVLNAEQKLAVSTIKKQVDHYQAFLLEGVTGSGKTEVYLRAIEDTLKRGKQALVLLPEIALTTQLIDRFTQYFEDAVILQHSRLGHAKRYQGWEQIRSGHGKIILGTRSAIWAPLHNPGLYIIDEEHDLSYKQQDSFHYSARDIALIRAKQDNATVILGSATPSMETLQNVQRKKLYHLQLSKRAGNAKPVNYNIIDLCGCQMHGAISQPLIQCIQTELNHHNQVLLFLNRRGYADHLLCHRCGWKVNCPRCDYPYTYHKQKDQLVCHHCQAKKPVLSTCPQCKKGPLARMGYGTERIEETLASLFPDARILRIDRDSTQKKKALHTLLHTISTGKADIIIGTQMITKGHHFPNITLVGIIDADRGLFGSDYRASERLAQLLIQVSGRSGRGDKPGHVAIQTHFPRHALLHTLITSGYPVFAKKLLEERQACGLPPFSYHALLRAEAPLSDTANAFLLEAKNQLSKNLHASLKLLGPVTAPIEKRSGKYRAQLLLEAEDRRILHQAIEPWLNDMDSSRLARKVRWSIDIDPQETV